MEAHLTAIFSHNSSFLVVVCDRNMSMILYRKICMKNKRFLCDPYTGTMYSDTEIVQNVAEMFVQLKFDQQVFLKIKRPIRTDTKARDCHCTTR